jgi:hypothetical protein
MDPIEIKEDELKQNFIAQMKHFLQNAKSENINELIIELDKYEPSLATYWDCSLRYSVQQWIKSNHELTELWKKTAINAANHIEFPFMIANTTVDEYKKKFNLNK